MSNHTERVQRTRDELRRIWTTQLAREYDHLVWTYRLPLKRPVIQVEVLASRWALYDPLVPMITINPRLIEDYAWDVVIEILKHEMAHQLVHAFGGDGRPHGPEFESACRRLRVADWAVRAAGNPVEAPIERASRALGLEEEKLLQRVEKLLALATSSNEHEALLAMQRVQEIYARHDIARLRARTRGTYEVITIRLDKKRVDRLTSVICGILSEHFFVEVIYGSQYVAEALGHYPSIELIGTRANVSMAEFVFRFLKERLDSLWTDYRKRTRCAAGARRDYMHGLLSGFRDKLSESRPQVLATAAGDASPTEATALIALGRRELGDFIHDRYPRLSKRYWTGGVRDDSTYEAGRSDGRQIVLNRPVNDRGPGGGHLPPA